MGDTRKAARRVLHRVGAWLGCGTLLFAAQTASGASCTEDPALTAPIAQSANHYFRYKGKTLALVGLSHEYLCHVQQPDRQSQYCSLENYPGVLGGLHTNKANIIRLWAIFNHSPGRADPNRGTPFTDEQPFKFTNGKWDLSVQANPNLALTNLNSTYFTNLESVVAEAFCQGIVVEVTLLDPWDGNWTTGPFSASNTITGTGFSAQRLFMSYENLTTLTDTGQNLFARNAQKVAVGQVVRQLKKYPNVIWEVANEPDFVPGGLGITVQDVMNWQSAMLQVILQYDTTHLIAINGETSTSFGWTAPQAQVANLHYAHNTLATQFGAIEVQRDTTSATSGRSNLALGFNENNAIPDQTGNQNLARPADDVRAEAWEFALNKGALFDGYSLDRSTLEVQSLSTQLGYLTDFLTPPQISGGIPTVIQNLDTLQKASCNGAGDWCQGVPAWGALVTEQGCTQVPLFWSTIKSPTDFALYLHHGNLRSALGGNKNDGYKEVFCGNGTSAGYRTSALRFSVPASGCWNILWKEPRTGVIRYSILKDLTANSLNDAPSPPSYKNDILFYVGLWRTGSCY